MGRGDSLSRQWKLFEILEERREISVPEIARELGYTVRTVYRDLLVLEDLGVPIYQQRAGRRARWRVVEGNRRRLALTLSWSEMLALSAGEKLLSGMAGTVFHESALRALDKVRAALPKELLARVDAGRALSAEVGPARDYAARDGSIRRLIEAIEKRETVRLEYRSRGKRAAEVRLADPYHLHIQAAALYLFAWCHAHGEVRTFLVDRIGQVEGTGQVFARKEGFSARDRLQGTFGPWHGKAEKVRLRFSAEVAPFVAERKVHPTQQAQWRDDGTLDVTLSVPLAPAVIRWVVGFGADARVMAPRKLAQRVRRVHEGAI